MIIRIILTLMLVLVPFAASPQGLLKLGITSGTEPEPNPNEALIRILEDADARAKLIESLRGEVAAEPEAEDQSQTSGDGEETQGRRLVVSTFEAAKSAAQWVSQTWAGLRKLPPTLASLGDVARSTAAVQAARDLAAVVVLTYAFLALLRFGARRIYLRMGRSAGRSTWIRTVFLSISSNFVALIAIILAWVLGAVILIVDSGGEGVAGIRQSLFLSAFLGIEVAKMLMRAVLAPQVPQLRLVSLPDGAARILSRWLGAALMILGYGHLVAVPIVDQAVSYISGDALETLISLFVIVMAAVLVARRRIQVKDWLVKSRAKDEERLRDVLAGYWYIPALLYLAVLFMVVASKPTGVLIPIFGSSGAIVLTIVAGMILTTVLKRSTRHGVSLPEAVTQRLPALEARLNRVVPSVLALIRIVIYFAVALITLDILGLTSLIRWVGVANAQEFWTVLISVTLLLAGLMAVWLAIASWIDYRLNPDFGSAPTARETTLLALLKNAVAIVLVIYAVMFALSEVGINIAPLIASAGILGLAIGFGAQKLVQDIITGVFIQLENAINVGDYVTVGGISGTVEQLTIRSVSLRDPEGTYHIIPFSSVDLVSNFTRDFSYFVCNMGVGYSEDIEIVKQAMFDAFEEMNKDSEVAANVLGELEWFGLQSFGDSAIVLRTRIMTRPGYQWGTGRAYNGALKKIFDERGIEIPFPHQTIYFGEDRHGNAPALNIRNVAPETS